MSRLTEHSIGNASPKPSAPSASGTSSAGTAYHNPLNSEVYDDPASKKKSLLSSFFPPDMLMLPGSKKPSSNASPSTGASGEEVRSARVQTEAAKGATATARPSPKKESSFEQHAQERRALLSASHRFHYCALCALCLPYTNREIDMDALGVLSTPRPSSASSSSPASSPSPPPSTSSTFSNSLLDADDQDALKALPRAAVSYGTLNDNDFSVAFIKGLVTRLSLSPNAGTTMIAFMSESNNRAMDIPVFASVLCTPDEPYIAWAVIQDLMDYSIADGVFDARARVLIRKVAKHLALDWLKVVEYEDILAVELRHVYTETEEQKQERLSKEKKAKLKKWLLVGAATIGGGALIGITGGLAAPMIAAGVGAIVGASGGAFLASAGGLALVTTLFGAAGAGLTGHKMHRRVGGLKEFDFKPISPSGRMHVVICMTGWLKDKEDTFAKPWITLDDVGEQYVVEWESKALVDLGQAITNLIKDQIVSYAAQEVLKQTILAGILAAVAWPAALISAAGVIDNPWTVAVNRSEDAGVELANVLQRRVQGCRPVTLVGFSLGARAIFKCLEELATCKIPVHGVIEDVYLFGAPVPADDIKWRSVRKIVSGRLVNGYCSSDWLLKFLYRTASAQLHIAGLDEVVLEGVENINLESIVSGHGDYPDKMPDILKRVGLSTSSSYSSSDQSAGAGDPAAKGAEGGEAPVQLSDLHALVGAQQTSE